MIKCTKHLIDTCNNLGRKYSIRTIDGEPCVYRDFHNGYDVEVSGVNTRKNRRVNIYLWKGKTQIVERFFDLPQSSIGDIVELLYKVYGQEQAVQYESAL